jgi:hypothetical protein
MTPITSSGKTLFHPIDKANALNSFFAHVSNMQQEPDIPLHGPGPPIHHPLDNFDISEQEVLGQLLTLNLNKPPGPDGISPKILKNIASWLYKSLLKLFDISLSSGKLPQLWKLAHITPVYESNGSAQDVNNYRPISITSVLCKILRK